MISNNDMTTYMRTPKNVFWEYRDGEYYALKSIEEAREYLDDMDKINKYKRALSDLDYYTNKWVEGVIDESKWEEVKTTRAELRRKINEIEAKYATE